MPHTFADITKILKSLDFQAFDGFAPKIRSQFWNLSQNLLDTSGSTP
jgi:hypothetical protein